MDFLGVSIIVGVDAGATVAFAVLYLNGKLVSLKSGKMPPEQVVELVSKHSPKVIACDTAKPSEFAKKLASAFGAKLYCPGKSLGKFQKISSTSFAKCANAHELDALAAALKAFHWKENKLRQAGKKARKAMVSEERVKTGVLKGQRMSELVK